MYAAIALVFLSFACFVASQPPNKEKFQAAICECKKQVTTSQKLQDAVHGCLRDAGVPVDEHLAACSSRRKRDNSFSSEELYGRKKRDTSISSEEAPFRRGRRGAKGAVKQAVKACLSSKGLSDAELEEIHTAGKAFHQCMKSQRN